jgi:hypothetical protein
MRILVFFYIQFCFFSINYSQFPNIIIDDKGSPNEPSICINPKNPAQLVAASNIDNFYFSSDTGKTWIKGRLSSDYGVWGDPAIICDTTGNFYFFHLSNAEEWIDRIVSQKSTDGGKTWNSGTYMGHFPGKNQDKQWAIVDDKSNNIYCTWTQFDNYGSSNKLDSSYILFSKSIDNGKTWTEAKRINKTAGDCLDDDNTVEGAVPAVGPEGEIYVAWAGPEGIVFDRSLDKGDTWLKDDIFVSDFPGGWNYEVPGIYRCNGLPVTCCDLSDGQYRGNIYINWTDQRNGENDTDVWLSRSKDNGNSWESPIRVNDDLPGRQQFFTWMTIDQSTGYLYFVYYDRRNHTDNSTDVYLTVSKNGGKSFENIKINESPFIPNKNAFFGDYTNISVVNGTIRPIWARMDNFKLSIMTALIDNNNLTAIKKEPEFSEHYFELYDNNPNPYRDKTSISFKLKNSSIVSIKIFDLFGNKIINLIDNQKFDSGKHILIVDNVQLKLSPGIYFYTLNIEKNMSTKKMIIQ